MDASDTGRQVRAWEQARRPKACKLVLYPRLQRLVARKLHADWSPEQIAGWLRQRVVEEPATTRKYARTLDPLPADVTERAVSKSAVSRRFVALTGARLAAWLATPLDGLDLRVVLIDGLHFRDHVILLALGLDAQGTKHILALREGTTENAAVCKALLTDVRERGLDLDRPTLFIVSVPWTASLTALGAWAMGRRAGARRGR